MSDYFLSIFAVSFILGILELLTFKPKGEGGERLAFAILLSFAVLSPIEGIVSSYEPSFPTVLPDFSEPSGSPVYEEKAKIAFEDGVLREISESFGINKKYIKVATRGFSFKEMKAEKITVTLSLGAAGADPKRIEEHIESFEAGECEVKFEIG